MHNEVPLKTACRLGLDVGELELVAINVHNMGRQWPQIVSNNTTYINYGYIDQLGTIEERLEGLEYTNSLVILVPRGLMLALKLCGILNYVGLYGYMDVLSPTHRWGDDHSSICCATDSKNHKGTGIWGAITHVNAIIKLIYFEDTVLSYPKLQCLPRWLGLLDELLVVLVFTNGIRLQSNCTHHCSLDLRSAGYNTSHLAIKQYTKIGNSFVNLQLELISTSTSVRNHTILTTSIHANRGDYTDNIHAINYSGDNPLGHEYIYNIKFGSNVRLLGNISIDSNTYTIDKQKHVNNTSKVVTYCNTPRLDTIKDRTYADHSSIVNGCGTIGTLCFIGLKEIPGDNTNRVCRDTYGNDQEEWGEWRAIDNNDDTIRLLVKDTIPYSTKWRRWSDLWKGKEKNKLVVVLSDSFVGLHSNCAHYHTPNVESYHWISFGSVYPR